MSGVSKYIAVGFAGLVLGLFCSCRPARPSVEEQVKEAMERFEVILDLGINSMMTLTLEDGVVHSTISQPTSAELEEFFTLFTERPVCQGLNEANEIINCIVNELKTANCVRVATCLSCFYPCS